MLLYVNVGYSMAICNYMLLLNMTNDHHDITHWTGAVKYCILPERDRTRITGKGLVVNQTKDLKHLGETNSLYY